MVGQGGVAWSPSSDLLAFAQNCVRTPNEARVLLASPSGGHRSLQLRLAGAEKPIAGDASQLDLWGFSPDGRWLLLGAESAGDSCIHAGVGAEARYIVSVNGTEQRRISTPSYIWSAVWSPDGREIAYSPVCFRECRALAVAAVGGRTRVLFRLAGPLNQDPAGLRLEWFSGALVVGAELNHRRMIYAVTAGRSRQVIGHGTLAQCACVDRIAFDTGERLVIANPDTGQRLTYQRRIYQGATAESVYLPR
jgi:hypothetical protein